MYILYKDRKSLRLEVLLGLLPRRCQVLRCYVRGSPPRSAPAWTLASWAVRCPGVGPSAERSAAAWRCRVAPRPLGRQCPADPSSQAGAARAQ